MKPTINDLQIRIHKLQQKDPVSNASIVAKLRRRIRALEK